MSIAIYKSGQGYWTRLLTAVGAGVVVLAGVAWLWKQLYVVNSKYLTLIQSGTAATIIVGTGLLLLWLLNKPSIVDFMIATEAEMRKVSWPTRRELILSTWVVICGTFMMSGLLFLVDILFVKFFQLIGVLESGSF